MNQERLKLIVHNLELLVNSLKEEIQDQSADYNYGEIASYIENDVDEYYVEGEDDV
jgi:hypothetical protein